MFAISVCRLRCVEGVKITVHAADFGGLYFSPCTALSVKAVQRIARLLYQYAGPAYRRRLLIDYLFEIFLRHRAAEGMIYAWRAQ